MILFLLTLATRRLFVTNFDENLLGGRGGLWAASLFRR